MNTSLKKPIFLELLSAGLCLMLTSRAVAQTFTILHSFSATDPNNYVNSDGADPIAGLVLSGKTLFGTAYEGGTYGSGTLFAVATDGSSFTNLHGFTKPSGFAAPNPDGASPVGGLVLSTVTLYGTTELGGDFGHGVVFGITTDGTGFTNLQSFAGDNGEFPYASLTVCSNTLYGSAGTVFEVSADGSGFTNLNVGAGPGGLILSVNTLYGTTENGGSNGTGTVFTLNTDGTGFSNLYNFSGYNPGYTNSDGMQPQSSLVISGNRLYGTAYKGGPAGNGTIFAISMDGTGFTNLHSFAPPNAGNPFQINTNGDGAYPYAGLLLAGHTLYGSTVQGGINGAGTIFALNTDGTCFTNLHVFSGSDGSAPQGTLVLSGNVLYGTASGQGYESNFGYGTVFSLTLPAPQLAIALSGTNVILTWPTNGAGFDFTGYTLQCATSLVSACWTNVSPGPAIVNGQLTVTNPISATRMFYRLTQ